MRRFWLASIVFLLVLSACSAAPAGSSGSIQIESPWLTSALTGDNTAFFMVIKNSASQDDQLIKAESDISMMVGLHKTEMKDNVMSMVEVPSIDVPAGGQAELKQGSFHVMVMGVNKDLKAGDKVHLILTFARAGKVALDVEVRNP